MGEYLKIAFPSMVMICSDWWVWEFMCLISGWLGVDEQAATVILMNLIVFIYLISMGYMTAASTFIGQNIGKNDVPMA